MVNIQIQLKTDNNMWLFTPTPKTFSTSGYNAIDVFNEYGIMLNEAIQNSMDAVYDEKKPVCIEISLEQIDKKKLHNFLFNPKSDEEKHFEISNKIPNTSKNVTIFKFEDYNTKGITGDVYDEKDGGSPMHAFLLSEGVTSKEKKKGKKGGSRGIGKSSFIYTSEYHTFFLSTVSDEGEMHLGRAYLEPKREINGKYYVKDAYFVENPDQNNIHSIEGDKLDSFKDIFFTDRMENGTSIFILSPKYPELKNTQKFIDSTLKSIVKIYYFLFIENKLAITIYDPTGKKHIINKDTIYDYMLTKGEFSHDFIEFIKNMYDEEIPEIIFNERQENFKGFINNINDENKNNFLNLYHSYDIFKATFLYWINGEEEQITYYIRKSDDRVKETHLRRHILHITKSAKVMRDKTKEKMYIGVNILADKPTEKTEDILKSCEDENHQEWKNQNQYEKDSIRLMVTNHIPEFLQSITENKKEQKKETFYVFDDVFPVKPEKGNDIGKIGGEQNDPPKHPDETFQDFNISKLIEDYGFTVSANTTQVPKRVIIRVGYKQERKATEQSIKSYRKHEFDVAKMPTQVSGAKISYQKDNEIHLSVVSPDFEFSITGFENEFNFDLAVDVKGEENETKS